MKIEFGEIVTHPVLAAVCGALLGLKALPGASIWERLANVGAGFVIAVFAGPALVDYMEVSSPNIGAGIIFGLGSAGLVLDAVRVAGHGVVIDAIRRTDLVAWVAGWLPRRKQGGE